MLLTLSLSLSLCTRLCALARLIRKTFGARPTADTEKPAAATTIDGRRANRQQMVTNRNGINCGCHSRVVRVLRVRMMFGPCGLRGSGADNSNGWPHWPVAVAAVCQKLRKRAASQWKRIYRVVYGGGEWRSGVARVVAATEPMAADMCECHCGRDARTSTHNANQ